MKQFFSMDRFRMRKLKQTLNRINQLSEVMRSLSDEELRAKTVEFKERLSLGERLDDLLPEAFAVVREVDFRVLGMFPYDVQVLGAIVLHQGNVAEMKTGEGKTLTATMPLYLNALTGKGAMLITPNDYLALRDCEEMGPVYEFLGLTVRAGVTDDPEKKMEAKDKRLIYQSDIVYTTNTALGFDYLIHNLASSKDGQYMRPFNYAILDEVDAVLLDMAQTPLVISGSPRVQSNLYGAADRFITTLTQDESYYYDPERKEVWLTQHGIDEAERYFNLSQLHVTQYSELVRHITLALSMHKTMEAGKHYLVEDDKVKLLDQTNGRTLDGTKLQGGLHQALEEKERVKLTDETRAMASITYQNLFLMFTKLSGMTGTGKTAESEFIETYNMEVVQIPTHKPIQRIDYPDQVYTTLPEKIFQSIDYLKSIHAMGRPILLVTGSVRMSELYSEMLLLEGIPHNLLNAFNAAKEAQMIAEAGQLGNVTIATTMAGRGTDIKLGPGVEELGGLAVIGTERMKSKRMDLQVKGRAGRQGNPGSSQFFVSLEDDLMISFGGKWVQNYFKRHKDKMDETNPTLLGHPRWSRLITRAQEASEGQGRSSRAMTLKFDESIKVQRDLIYRERDAILDGDSGHFKLETLLDQALEDFLRGDLSQDSFEVQRFILDKIDHHYKDNTLPAEWSKDAIRDYLTTLITDMLMIKKKQLRNPADYDTFIRIAVLKAIDEAWIENVDYLQQLRTLVIGRQTAQRNAVYEYHREALAAFQKMKQDIRARVLQYVMLGEISYTPKDDLEIYFS